LKTSPLNYKDVRLRPSIDQAASTPSSAQTTITDRATISPDDRLEQALSELRRGVVAELLDLLSRVSPEYFETVVLDLLHKMGYGTSRADLLRVGRSGDRGIDGIIALDRLGLEKVYVQAKRWQNSVGRPEVQALYGALAGRQAKEERGHDDSVFQVAGRQLRLSAAECRRVFVRTPPLRDPSAPMSRAGCRL
jgi:restriction system protein